MMEEAFARLRREAVEAAGALQLLEMRLAEGVGGLPKITPELWNDLLTRVALETSTLLAEIQRRFDTSGVEVIRRPSNVDHEKFREVVPRPDLDHIASAAGVAESRKCKVIFVTLESQLHANRDRIFNLDPALVVTTAPYLRGQVERLRATV